MHFQVVRSFPKQLEWKISLIAFWTFQLLTNCACPNEYDGVMSQYEVLIVHKIIKQWLYTIV